MNQVFIGQNIKSIAHRGYSLKHNTLQSFNRAFGLGFDMIEIDIQICKDDVVIFHDLTIKDRYISDLTYNEINKIDRDIMNLDFFMKNFSYSVIDIYFDLKGSINIIDKMFDYFKKNKVNTSNFYMASFNLSHIEKLNLLKKNFNFKIGFITQNSFTLKILSDLIKNLDFIVYEIDYLNCQEIDFLKKNNILVFTYTLTKKLQYDKVKQFNIDGIVTDILF